MNSDAMMTPKQAAAQVRKHLKDAVEGSKTGQALAFAMKDGSEYQLKLPRGLSFDVRATKSGVNVSINEGYGQPSYIDDVTGGDRESLRRDHLTPVVDLITDYQERIFRRTLGKIEWGHILISAHPTGESRTIRSGEES